MVVLIEKMLTTCFLKFGCNIVQRNLGNLIFVFRVQLVTISTFTCNYFCECPSLIGRCIRKMNRECHWIEVKGFQIVLLLATLMLF